METSLVNPERISMNERTNRNSRRDNPFSQTIWTTTTLWHEKQKVSEADVSSSHAVSQFVLVPKERHEAHVGLDVDQVVQDKDAVGLPGKGLHGVGVLRRLVEPLSKVLHLWREGGRIRDVIRENTCISCLQLSRVGHGVVTNSGTLVNWAVKQFYTVPIDWSTHVAEGIECVADAPHRVVGEGDEGEVSGEGVPPGGKGGLPQPVPEDSQPLPLPPGRIKTHRNTNVRVSPVSHHINDVTQHYYKQVLVMFSIERDALFKNTN